MFSNEFIATHKERSAYQRKLIMWMGGMDLEYWVQVYMRQMIQEQVGGE